MQSTAGGGGGEAPGESRGHQRRVSSATVLPVVASACLWFLLQRGTLTAPFKGLELMGTSLGTLLTTACIVGCALVMGVLGPRIGNLLSRPWAVMTAGVLGGAALLGGTLAGIALGAPVPMALLIGCMLLEALGFCSVFLAWCQAFSFQVTRCGLSRVLLDQLIAVAISIPVSQAGSFVVVGGVPLLDVAALPLAAGCFVWWSRSRGVAAVAPGATALGPVPTGQSDSQSRTRDVLWMVTIGGAFFFAGLLSYLPRLNDMTVDMGTEDPLTIGFTVVFLVPLMLVCIRIGKTGGGADRSTLFALLAVTLVILVAFFVLTLSMSSALAIQYGLARFVRRASRVVTFLFLLLFVYRVGFCPVRCFALGFLVPMYAPKLLVYWAALVIPNAAAFSLSQVLVFALAMAVTLCLVVVLFLNFDGGLVRQMAGVSIKEAGTERPVDRQGYCRSLGAESGLTDREIDILCLLSQGYSGAKVCEELNISRGTLNTHSTSIYRKLGIHSKQELIDLVDEHLREGSSPSPSTMR